MSDSFDQNSTRKEQLEKIKLVEEIKNLRRPFFKTPTFWPPFLAFLTAFTVYLYTWQSGIFDLREKTIQYRTDTLQKIFNALQREVNTKRDSLHLLTSQNQSLVYANGILTKDIETTKKAKDQAINDITKSITKKNLTKKELKEKTLSLIRRYRMAKKQNDFLMDTTRRYWDSVQKASPKYSPSISENQRQAESAIYDQLKIEYQESFADSAMFLHQQLILQIPGYIEHDSVYINSQYKHPVNHFGIEDVFENLLKLVGQISEEFIPLKTNSNKKK